MLSKCSTTEQSYLLALLGSLNLPRTVLASPRPSLSSTTAADGFWACAADRFWACARNHTSLSLGLPHACLLFLEYSSNLPTAPKCLPSLPRSVQALLSQTPP